MPEGQSGGIFLSGALIVAGLGGLVGCITFLFHQLITAKDTQIDDLRTRANLQDQKIERLSTRLTDGLEQTVRENAAALGELNANMLARFRDLEEVVGSAVEPRDGREGRR